MNQPAQQTDISPFMCAVLFVVCQLVLAVGSSFVN